MSFRTIVACLLLSLVNLPPADATPIASLTQVARRTMEYYFDTGRLKTGSLSAFARGLPADNLRAAPQGVFVTLSRGGKSRACWGSLSPEHEDLVTQTVYATVGALTREYRYHPISASEWPKLKVQVTVVRAVEPMHGIAGQNPLRDGLLVRSGGKSGVLLPGEASDAIKSYANSPEAASSGKDARQS